MKTSAKILIPTLILGVMAGTSALGIKNADAHWFGFGKGKENRDSLIQRLVDRFNLNKSEVEETFEQHREQMQEQRRQRQEEHLSQLVSEGKLTEDQKTFLSKARAFKENYSNRINRFKELAKLNKDEIRPFVMQMLQSDKPDAALIVLQVWKDKESLPVIKKMISSEANSGVKSRMPIAAYLNIEGTGRSIKTILSMTGGSNGMSPMMTPNPALAI